MSLGTPIPPRILINGSQLNVVGKFSYLGSVVNSSNNLDDEIKQRTGKASTNFGRLSFQVRNNHHLTIKLKIRVYTSCVLSVLLYSSETRCKYTGSMYFIWNAFAPFLVSHGEIMSLTLPSCISPVHMTSPPSWGSDVCAGWAPFRRVGDGRLLKDIFYSEFFNARRRTGRPKLRYKDVIIKRDMASFHISPQSWETLAANRNRCRALWVTVIHCQPQAT